MTTASESCDRIDSAKSTNPRMPLDRVIGILHLVSQELEVPGFVFSSNIPVDHTSHGGPPSIHQSIHGYTVVHICKGTRREQARRFRLTGHDRPRLLPSGRWQQHQLTSCHRPLDGNQLAAGYCAGEAWHSTRWGWYCLKFKHPSIHHRYLWNHIQPSRYAVQSLAMSVSFLLTSR